MDSADPLNRLLTGAQDEFARARILVAYAYGSRIAGTARAGSDMDVGYYLPGYREGEALPIREEMALASRLSDAAGVEVDLRNLARAPLEVRGRVLVEGRRLYCSDEVGRVTLERELLGRYPDYQDSFRAMHRLRLERVARFGLRPMIDRAKLDQMLSNLEGYLAVLRSIGRVPRSEFLANADKVGNAKYHFVVAIECCIDVANHLIASERYRLPRDSADCFVILVENAVVPERLREPLRAMARFRNHLVHVYWDVDDAAVRDYLRGSLQDIDDFARAVGAIGA